MSELPDFANLLAGPWPASPFPAASAAAALVPPPIVPPVPNWAQLPASERHPYFNAVAYFTQCYGVLPWCRVFRLGGEMKRTRLLAELAGRFDVAGAAVAHAEFFEAAGESAQYPHTVLALAPHLLLELDDEELFQVGCRTDVTLYYSTRTDPALLHELTSLLHSRLPQPVPAESELRILQATDHGLRFVPVAFDPVAADLPTHYNDDLLPVHELLLRRLQAPRDKGLAILHGPPGTGKTSYLRYLCAQLPHKRKLLVPPHLAAQLAEPGFMALLAKEPNSLLIIEDAEQLLLRRDRSGPGPSAVSSLLNLSDGFLADVLHIQFLCTFNNDLALLDPALLRKGRLIAAYHFGPLALPKTQALAAALGWGKVPGAPLTLAELYNPDDPTFAPVGTVGRVGFGRREGG